MSWNSQFEVKHPTQTIAPFLQSGMNVPYNLKLYRGYCTMVGSGQTTRGWYLHYVQNPTEVIYLDPGSVIVGATMYAPTALTGTDTLSLAITSTVPTPTISPTNDGGVVPATIAAGVDVTTAITNASVSVGAVLPFGAIGGNNAVSPMASATYGWPIVENVWVGGGTLAAGTVYVTLLVMENINV